MECCQSKIRDHYSDSLIELCILNSYNVVKSVLFDYAEYYFKNILKVFAL